MDIFTTQLTRVVPVRIIPEKLEVKALAKENAVRSLNDKDQHFVNEATEDHKKKRHQQSSSGQDKPTQSSVADELTDDQAENTPSSPFPTKHLDIYV